MTFFRFTQHVKTNLLVLHLFVHSQMARQDQFFVPDKVTVSMNQYYSLNIWSLSIFSLWKFIIVSLITSRHSRIQKYFGRTVETQSNWEHYKKNGLSKDE